jgi:hypothetical protein
MYRNLSFSLTAAAGDDMVHPDIDNRLPLNQIQLSDVQISSVFKKFLTIDVQVYRCDIVVAAS